MTALPAGTYEDGSPSVTQQGDWTRASSTYDSGGSVSSLTGTGYAEMSFATSGIRWVTRTNAYSGIADVYVDGVKKTSVDLYSATTKYKQVAYEISGLPETPHTLRIVRTGTKNPSSTGSAIMLDAFVAPDIYPPQAPTAPVAAPGRGSVQLGWNASPDSDVVGYRVYRTAVTDPSAATSSSTTPAATAGRRSPRAPASRSS